jgi:hypothetical protein
MTLHVAPTISITSFSNIWETGDLPSIWKLANVIPIPKLGKDHSEPSNYRRGWQFNLETKLRQEVRRFCFNVLRAFALKMPKFPRLSDVGCFPNRRSTFLRFLMAQKIKGKNNKTNVHHLKDGHDTLTSEQDISNKCAPILFQCSSSFRPEDAKIAEVVRFWMFSEPSFVTLSYTPFFF